MCSRPCDRPAPSHFPSVMLPVWHHAWAETTGALWSSRVMITRPFSNVVSFAPGGMAGISSDAPRPDLRAGTRLLADLDLTDEVFLSETSRAVFFLSLFVILSGERTE